MTSKEFKEMLEGKTIKYFKYHPCKRYRIEDIYSISDVQIDYIEFTDGTKLVFSQENGCLTHIENFLFADGKKAIVKDKDIEVG